MANRYFLNIGANWGDTANWSDTSGGTGGFSVPTNVDDVFFDANSGNCTVNASARTALTLNFTGYTNTITMTNNITVSGNVTLGAGMGIAGTGQLIVNTTATLTSNGKTWSAGFTFSGTSQTYTLADNWAISGLIRFSGTTACTINSNTITASGGFQTTTNAGTTGTTSITWTGGTWSDTGAGNIRNNLTINGNVTISGTVFYSTGTLTYTGGTVTVTNSRLRVNTCTLDLNTLTLNNFQTDGASTYTLLSDLNINGEWYANVNGTTINGTFNINVSNGLNNLGGISQGTGTTTLNLLGGTWTGGALRLNTNINGNITISGNVYYNTGILTYTSGTVTTTGSTLNIDGSTTLNTSGMSWNNVTFSANNLTTLTSNLNVNRLLTISGNTTVNGTFNINANGGITVINNVIFAQGTGTTTLNLLGGTWSITGTGVIRLNTVINGNITISGNVYYNTGTLTYTSGTVTTTGSTLNVGANTIFIDCDKINFRTVIITAGTTQTFNRFFSGSALVPTRIQSTGTNYTITFQDTFEKITKFTKISNCTVSRPGQLLGITDKSNKGGNVGIRYINQSPNGLPKNSPPIPTQMTFGIGNISDPTTVIS